MKAAVRDLTVVLVILFYTGLTPSLGLGTTIGSSITAGGYTFVNFDPPLVGNAAGSNANGISNTGRVVGTQVDANNASTFVNYAGVPTSTAALNTGVNQIAFGINSSGNVVGGNGDTGFYLPQGGAVQPLMNLTFAFGINDKGNIVGQTMSLQGTAPGIFLPSATSNSFVTINAPTGPNTVNAQGINNNGQIVGFYLGTDGRFTAFKPTRATRSTMS